MTDEWLRTRLNWRVDPAGPATYTCLMAFGIILYDETRTIRAIDDAAAILFARPAQELLGRNLYDFIPRPDREQMAAARATFERNGEASGQYAIEREDGFRESITFSVLANAPMPGLNLMAIAPSAAEVASDAARIRRVGNDVHPGLELSWEKQWHGTSPRGMSSVQRSDAGTEASRNLVAAVFPTEEDAWFALLEVQPTVEARAELALSSFDGGWPRDNRSVLAIRGDDGHFDGIAAIIAKFDGTLMTGRASI
jgi:PAS domain-containing protein